MENVFTYIYENRVWSYKDEKDVITSGHGSSLEYNRDYISFIHKFISEKKISMPTDVERNIKTVVDLGCGECSILHQLYDNLDIEYFGYDCYKTIVDRAVKTYTENVADGSTNKFNFHHMDIYKDRKFIVPSDLVIIKDVLQHWACPRNIHIFKLFSELR